MADRDALGIINAVEDELGLDRTVGVGALTINTRQIKAFVNASIEEAVFFGNWSGLEKAAVIEFGAPVTMSATVVADSASVTLADSSTLSTAFAVTGEGLQEGTRIAAVPDGTHVTLDKTADESGTVDLTFIRDTFNLPSDFHFWIPQTHWDSRMKWQLIGPTSSQFDAWQRNGIVGPFPRRQFRRQGPAPTAFRIFPPPSSAGDYPGTLTYRYITQNAVLTAAGVAKRFFDTENDDTCLIPDRVLILGAKWRWQQAKGFDFGPLQEEYYNWLDGTEVADRGEVVVSCDGIDPNDTWLDLIPRVQDGNFPGPA